MTARGHSTNASALAIAIVGVGVLGTLLVDGPGRWVAVAAVFAGLPELGARLPQLRGAWVRLRQWLPQAALALACVALFGELLAGHPPASRDHAIHLFEIHLLVDEFLPAGRVSGWTNAFNNGLPFGEAYPWFPDLWSAALHLVSFGRISIRTSYAWGLAAVWILAAVGVWMLAARVTTEIDAEGDPARTKRIAAWAGCVGALTWLLDPGQSRQGGWAYLMFHGVWPQLLSATLWVLALVLTWRAFERPSPRRIAAAGLVLGGSVLAHPFGILTMACSGAVWLAVLAYAPRADRVPAGRFVWWLWIHAIAAVIAFGWVASFLAGAEALGRAPVPWESMGTLASDLVSGTLFMGHAAWTGPLVLLGLLFALRRGGPIAWLVFGLALGMLVLASEAAITVLRLDLIAGGFKNIQFPRYAIAIKPLLFALAGAGAALGVAWLRKGYPPGRPLNLPQRFVVGLVLAPFAIALLEAPGRMAPRPVAGIDSLEASGEADHEAALTAALRDERAALGQTPLTIAFFRRGMGGGMYPVMSVAEVGARLVVDSHIATVNFEHAFVRRNLAALRGMGVTHVIHDMPLQAPEDLAIALTLDEVGVFGPYTLERVRDRPAPSLARGIVWNAEATVTVARRDAHRWVLDVSGNGGPVRLRLPLPLHPKWVASLDGESLSPQPTKLWGGAADGMTLNIPHDGRVELHYVDGPAERRARGIALLIAAACLLALVRAAPIVVPPWRPTQRAMRIVVGASVALGLSALGWVGRRQQTRLQRTWLDMATELRSTQATQWQLVSDAAIDEDVEIVRDPPQVCVGLLGKNDLAGCSEAEHAPQLSFLYREPYLYRCVQFTVPAGGTAKAFLPGSRSLEGTRVIGTVVRTLRKGKGTNVLVSSGKHWRAVGNAPRDISVSGAVAERGPAVKLRNDGRRAESLCLALAVLEPEG